MKIWAPLTLSLALPRCDLGSGHPHDLPRGPHSTATSSHSPTCDASGTVDPHPDLSTLCTGDVVAFIGESTHESIQDAIDAATSGDTVFICPGTHTDRLVAESLTVTLAAASGDPSDTRLDGEGFHRILEIAKVELTLYNLTLQDGFGSLGGAIEAESSLLDLQCVTFANNIASISGGAIDFNLGSLSASHSTFVDNLASEEGGAVRWGGSFDASILLDDVTFEGNTSGTVGGALHLGDKAPLDSVLVYDSFFLDNTAADGGGAIALDTTGGMNVQISGTELSDNSTEDVGGAILVDGRAKEYDVWLEDVLFEANIAPSSGAAVQVTDTPLFVDIDFYSSTVMANESTDGAAVRTSDRSVLWSEDSDWGVTGSSLDNVGDDLSCQCGDYDALQSSESFLCNLDGTWQTGS